MLVLIGILILAACLYIITRLKSQKLPQFDLNKGVDEINESYCILDLRDYNVSYKSPLKCAYNIPSAYLKRYYSEIPKKDILVVADDLKWVFPDIRFLRRKGYHVAGFVPLESHERLLRLCESL